MKVTSLKDVETYIYSSVIMPLKHLNVPQLDYPSPITGKSGKQWLLFTRQASVPRHYRRQYQRTRAQRQAGDLIILHNGVREYVVGSYDNKNHWVKLYERPFKRLCAVPLMGKLQDALNRNTPFTKVIIEQNAPVSREARPVFDRGGEPRPEGYPDDLEPRVSYRDLYEGDSYD